MSDADIAWAAGLMVGEGNVGITYQWKKEQQKTYEYLHIQLGMYDEVAVDRFANTFGTTYHTFFLKAQQHIFYKVMMRGRAAELALGKMWPWIEDTEKGYQALHHAKQLGVEDWVMGLRTDRREQRHEMPRGPAPKG